MLRLYARDGPAFVRRLRGMYAFALYDATRQGLLLGRDPYGIKPLYVADDGRTLRVASQVKALLAGGGIDTTPDPAGRVGFWLWGHVPEPFTFFRGIRALPAGCTMWVDASGARAPVQATPTIAEMLTPDPSAQAEAAPTVRDALLDSVRHHLVADVDVGVFLSSGRDSAALVGLATELQGRVRTVTLGFREFVGTDYDEVPLAEAIARHYGTDHTTVWVSKDDFRASHDDVLAAMDQPTIDGVNTYFVSRAASQTGLKVALSGLGGDELFGGYRSFRHVPRLVHGVRYVPRPLGRALRHLLAPLLSTPAMHRALGGVFAGQTPKLAGLLEYGGTYGGAYLLERAMRMPWEIEEVLDPAFVREGLQALDFERRLNALVAGIPTTQGRVAALESNGYMRQQLLRDSDWASMAHSLEVRVPFVDPVLTQSLAGRMGASGLISKDALARSARPLLPEEILSRPKTGFAIPVREWMGHTDAAAARQGLRGWATHVSQHIYAS